MRDPRTFGIARRPALLVLLGAALYLYGNLFVSGWVPILLTGDQVVFWMYGQRLLFGEEPYRDFFQYTPPGTDLVYFLLFKFFGIQIWITNLVVLVLGVALCWLCFAIARHWMQVRSALLATIVFLTVIYGRLLNATHHWFSVLFILCAVEILLGKQSSGRILAAGLLLGSASFFTQSHALAGLLAILGWLVWLHVHSHNRSKVALLQKVALLLAGFAATLVLLNGHFLANGGLARLWYFQVTYVRQYRVGGPETNFLGMPAWRGWGHFLASAQYMLIYALLPIVYALALWRSRSLDLFSEQRKAITLLAGVGVLLFCEVMFSLNWLRVYAVSAPALILLPWLIGQARAFRAVLTAMIWAGVGLIAIVQTLMRQHASYAIAEFPAGWTATSPGKSSELKWMAHHTRPGAFLFQAAGPGVYLPLHLRNPIFADGVGIGTATPPELVQQSVRELEQKQVRYILWSQLLDPADKSDFSKRYLAPLHAYLRERFKRTQVFANGDEMWERN